MNGIARNTLMSMTCLLLAGCASKPLQFENDFIRWRHDPQDGSLTGVSPGTAKVTVKAAAKGSYKAGQTVITVTVKAYSLLTAGTVITVSSAEQVYDGKAKTPAVTVRDKYGKTLKKGTDYTLIYSSNINAGTNTGKVSITGTGSYSGTTVKTFTIKKAAQPLSIKVSSAKAAVGKTVTVTVTGAKGKKTYSSSAPTVAAELLRSIKAPTKPLAKVHRPSIPRRILPSRMPLWSLPLLKASLLKF